MRWGEICQQWHLLEAFLVDLRIALLLPLILVTAGFFLLLLFLLLLSP